MVVLKKEGKIFCFLKFVFLQVVFPNVVVTLKLFILFMVFLFHLYLLQEWRTTMFTPMYGLITEKREKLFTFVRFIVPK